MQINFSYFRFIVAKIYYKDLQHLQQSPGITAFYNGKFQYQPHKKCPKNPPKSYLDDEDYSPTSDLDFMKTLPAKRKLKKTEKQGKGKGKVPAKTNHDEDQSKTDDSEPTQQTQKKMKQDKGKENYDLEQSDTEEEQPPQQKTKQKDSWSKVEGPEKEHSKTKSQNTVVLKNSKRSIVHCHQKLR